MRVITGSARGRRLRELEGMETRPTTDRVKEGMFSILQFDIEGRRVLDLFAGTGQLGIECLSRGAAEVTFVDRRGDAVRLIRENLRVTNLEGSLPETPWNICAQQSSGLTSFSWIRPMLPGCWRRRWKRLLELTFSLPMV